MRKILLVLSFFWPVFLNFQLTICAQEKEQHPLPRVELTDFQIYNKSVPVGPWKNGRIILKKPISETSKVILAYKDKMFTITFAAAGSISPDTYKFAFKMEGFDHEWHYIDSKRDSLTFTNFEPAIYTFKVCSSKLNGEKSKFEKKLIIEIKAPFRKTIWFKLLMVISVVLIIFTFVKIKTARTKKHRERELKVTQMEAQLSKAELKALKAQLQPHFLFNTLNVISSLMHENVDAADEAITRLGDLLRLMFTNSGNQMVSLQDEIEFIKIYLELHRVRFQDKLETFLHIENSLNAAVPNLILQPLVENAIKHSYLKKDKKTVITIKSQKKDNKLILQIEDNGPGIDKNNDSIDITEIISNSRGFGLKSTQERLQNLYGPHFIFKLKNSPAGGLIVTIKIPYNFNKEEKNE